MQARLYVELGFFLMASSVLISLLSEIETFFSPRSMSVAIRETSVQL